MDQLPLFIRLAAGVPAILFGLYYWYRASKTSRYMGVAFVVVIAFGFAIEWLDMRATNSYYYRQVLIMLGSPPGWVPLMVCISWANLLFISQTTTDRLGLPWYQRPLLDATIPMILDLMMDPISSTSSYISQYGESCIGNPTFGEGVGLWVWCVPQGDTALWLNVPLANFFGWWLVIVTMSFGIRLGQRFLQGEHRPLGVQISILVGAALLSIVAVRGITSVYLWLLRPEWAQLLALAGAVLVPIGLVVAQRKKLNFHNARDLKLVSMPILAFFGGVYSVFSRGVGQDQWPWSAVALIAAGLLSVFLFLLPYLGTLTGGGREATQE